MIKDINLMNKKIKIKTKKSAKVYNYIQVCNICGKIDAKKNDGHNCFIHSQNRYNDDYYD